MKERALLTGIGVVACLAIFIAAPTAEAYVDAKYWVKDDEGSTIYMRTDTSGMIYGNVLVGQQVLFDASQSQSYYGKVDKYYWDWNSDSNYDVICRSPYTHHTFQTPGIYRVKLMAVDEDGPPGAGDTYTKQVSVVESFATPVPAFTLAKKNNSNSYHFNASVSYDPDGYVKYYRWDFTGDGVMDEEQYRVSNATHTYPSDGYYTIQLTVEDWDGCTNATRHILRVGSPDNSSERDHMITVVNQRDSPAAVTVTVNNWKTMSVTIQDKKRFTAPFREDGENEIKVACNDTARSFFCSGDITVYLADGGFARGGNSVPGPGVLLVFVAAALAVLLRRRVNI